VVFLSDDGKWNCTALVSPCQSSLDVGCGGSFACRDGTPLIEFGIVARCGYEAVDMAAFQRFEADALALQREALRTHHSYYAMDAR
jgi:hypothetical protein